MQMYLVIMYYFSISQYLGLWYEQEKYPFLFELGGKCITATYGLLADGNVSVLNKQKGKWTNKESSVTGTARIESPGKLSVSFNGVPGNRASNYWVVGTDYSSYAVVYSCSNVLFFSKSKILLEGYRNNFQSNNFTLQELCGF
jgi:apolipoprotein D and lipocalin family protein